MDTITVTDLEGLEHELPAREGLRVMEIIAGNGLPMKAVCGGSCACGTCHVFVLDDWTCRLAPAAREELDMLDFLPATQPNSRLACQLRFASPLAGLRLQIAPEY
jgi:2Fe-2S ferredoxin